MIKKTLVFIFYCYLFGISFLYCQNVTLYNQFNGRYDFTYVGNTLNPQENSFMGTASVLTSSSSTLNLAPTDVIESAYLYWAGSGTGDFDIKLNGIAITPERTFSHQRTSGTLVLDYFSAFKNITSQVQATGNGTYTLSELDVSAFIDSHFIRRTNFAGWAIVVVYKNASLPLNQLNIYDGLQAVPSVVDITLNSLNVIDNMDAKIGFIAWEGDVGIAVNESLRINGNTLSNPPLNPINNAFNGTNSETGASNLFNMDLDIYDIQSNINAGDTSASIQLTSNQDFVMINAIVTKLNSQLPDATVQINNVQKICDSRSITVDYNIKNFNSTALLPSGTFITIYVNNIALTTIQTPEDIPIGESRNYQITLTIPDVFLFNFDLKFVVDDNNGVGIVNEINENNNSDIEGITLTILPQFNILSNFINCKEKGNSNIFDFSSYEILIKNLETDVVTFHENNADAIAGTNLILNASNYSTETSPKTIYVRIANGSCFVIATFQLIQKICEPIVYNSFTPNGDGLNDSFFIENLRDNFNNFQLYIYNRWGTLLWQGDKNIPDWDGYSNVGNKIITGDLPVGTYYYVLHLNDLNYPEAKTGWVYLNR